MNVNYWSMLGVFYELIVLVLLMGYFFIMAKIFPEGEQGRYGCLYWLVGIMLPGFAQVIFCYRITILLFIVYLICQIVFGGGIRFIGGLGGSPYYPGNPHYEDKKSKGLE